MSDGLGDSSRKAIRGEMGEEEGGGEGAGGGGGVEGVNNLDAVVFDTWIDYTVHA